MYFELIFVLTTHDEPHDEKVHLCSMGTQR